MFKNRLNTMFSFFNFWLNASERIDINELLTDIDVASKFEERRKV